MMFSMKKIALTGIKPTGLPHIGNYFGAIRPALDLVGQYEARYFIADYHALNQTKDPKELAASIREVAAAWLACGLDPDKVLMYRQSSVPETFELATVLMCFTPKGLMNRAHAYKAQVQLNEEEGRDIDSGVNMGLFTYPVLMAADILLFDTDAVPVGRDQVQHVEMTADIAQALNHNYGSEVLRIPQALVRAESAIVPGLDGRKMSKSYGNSIPLAMPEKDLRKLVMRIVTNSQGVEEPKDPDTCSIYALHSFFASKEEKTALAARYRAGGMGWGQAKEALFEVMNRELSPLRARYEAIMADPVSLDRILAQGAQKAREIASRTISRVRKAVGMD
jgi:tryptophanyl-tRNA synthetase